MKRLYSILLLLGFLALNSCEKELPELLNYRSYEFNELDENAGEWNTVLGITDSQIQIEAPAGVSSSSYLQELQQLKDRQKSTSGEERKSVTYWTSNPTNRWNEIALELIAKYNIIPGPNDDGTYTLPNPDNPEGPPAFPFAHPPYASRALAYLSVSQYDGQVLAWKYKYRYNRPAPYSVDEDIASAYVKSTLPSYPSEGAVVAEASKAILTAMFPLEKEYLEQKAAEHLNSIYMAGAAVKSDIDAGIKIGKEVAAIALTRASGDGMKNAQAPKAVSDSIKNAALDRFGWAWDNLEIPVRPVGLAPLFGKVKMWNIEKVENVRPIPPPAIGSKAYENDVVLLKNYAKNMNENYRRIANFWQDGLGTYTPPGHWNRIAKEIIVEEKLNPIRTARVYAYMNMAIMDGGISCWDAKYYYHYPRPIQMIEGFQTIAGTPNFPSYTSGHSVFSAAGSEVLAYFFPDRAAVLRGWAEEAAISRVYGGIHWSFDATVGTDQGRKVAAFSIDKARLDAAE
ncbi:phosphatase PAP2 family protein [Jiulongibacter sediminis]|uniref:phosphatase PAP2 family protein n=1 Tax=Jiulongibacter sediminis TaxID=1605367 RepID=UPI0026EFCF7D|nr:phosphatase PAP2 family protein [Jiulongibacter sediminis]